jgi:hypothetical protein
MSISDILAQLYTYIKAIKVLDNPNASKFQKQTANDMLGRLLIQVF